MTNIGVLRSGDKVHVHLQKDGMSIAHAYGDKVYFEPDKHFDVCFVISDGAIVAMFYGPITAISDVKMWVSSGAKLEPEGVSFGLQLPEDIGRASSLHREITWAEFLEKYGLSAYRKSV